MTRTETLENIIKDIETILDKYTFDEDLEKVVSYILSDTIDQLKNKIQLIKHRM